MKHEIKHGLDVETAKKVADKAFASYKDRFAKYNPNFRWLNDQHGEVTFSAKGFDIKGDVEMLPGTIAVDLEVPFVLRPFKGKAMDVIDREIKAWVAKAKDGTL